MLRRELRLVCEDDGDRVWVDDAEEQKLKAGET